MRPLTNEEKKDSGEFFIKQFKNTEMNNVDTEYFRLLKTILDTGRTKHNRTGVDTIGVFGAQAKFDVSMDAFPILTTKKVWFKGIVHELLWFLKGDTNIKYLVDNGVHIWDEWAAKRYFDAHTINGICNSVYTQEQFIQLISENDRFANDWGDLGEGTYGGMWRKFPYLHEEKDTPEHPCEYPFVPGYVDQIQKVMDKLKTNPDDRRMIVSAWHPYWAENCALSPCHCFMQFNTEELTHEECCYAWGAGEHGFSDVKSEDLDKWGAPKRRLNLLMLIRSNDMFLGAPFNITSYSLLIAMVAQCVGMVPGTLTYAIGDAHIYVNHLEQVKEQLTRTPMVLPKLWLNPEIKDIFSFKYEDIKLVDYKSHPAIKADVAV